MNIGIYIGGTPNRQIDCRNIMEDGNPGIGGTEYEFVMLASYLAQHTVQAGISLRVFQSGKYLLHDSVPSTAGIHQSDILEVSKSHGIDILIVDSRLPLDLIKSFNGSGLST